MELGERERQAPAALLLEVGPEDAAGFDDCRFPQRRPYEAPAEEDAEIGVERPNGLDPVANR